MFPAVKNNFIDYIKRVYKSILALPTLESHKRGFISFTLALLVISICLSLLIANVHFDSVLIALMTLSINIERISRNDDFNSSIMLSFLALWFYIIVFVSPLGSVALLNIFLK
jgi:hypothetical protein